MNIYILAAWQINVEFGEFNWLLTIYHVFVINLAVDPSLQSLRRYKKYSK